MIPSASTRFRHRHTVLRVGACSVLLTLSSLSTQAAPQPTAHAVAVTTQLPRTVRPLHYDVAVTPHAATLSFDGTVAVDIEVLTAARAITLNAVDLQFSSVKLVRAGRPDLPAPTVSTDPAAQTATFAFAAPLAPGKYRLTMAYTGKVLTLPNGLFAIDYDNGGKQRALFTQFENSDARRFIPCWDEPSYKATFTLTATVPAGMMAVSNMPAASTTDAGPGLVRVAFPASPKMSSYLLFFGVGQLDRTTTTADGTELGVVTQKGKSSQAAFALASSAEVLHEYNGYFATPYPLPKLDNIASPGASQFFSAMENWGAIYTFEHTLLLDPAIATQEDRQRVFSVAAHEMAHQWFGDLVTMAWWDDLWLNEGFASWMAARTTDKLHPEWKTGLRAVEDRAQAMGRDAYATTHPVVQHVQTVEQAAQAFDAITYQKGEAVIRMLEAHVGADAWREGVRRYMKLHAYGNTATDDLWREVEAAAHMPVTAIAHDFTLQPGIPLIRAEAGACSDGKTPVTLTQGEFTRDRPEKAPLAWRVPVIAQVGGGAPVRTLVTGGKASVSLPGCGPLLVNVGQTGYYRTLYAAPQATSLRNAYAGLAPIDQLGVMDDAWALGQVGLQPIGDFLDIVAATPPNAEPQVWVNIARALQTLDGYYAADPARRAAFRAYAIVQLTPVFARVGWDAKPDDAGPVKVLRNELLGALGTFGDPAVVAEARRRDTASLTDPKAVTGELRKTVWRIVAQHADATTWDRYHAAAKVESTPLVRDQLYRLLSSADDPALARRALDLAITDEPGATNSAGMVQTVSRSHPDMAFDYAMAHRADIDKRLDPTAGSRGYYANLGMMSVDPAMVAKIQADTDAHVAADSRKPAETAMATIRYRAMVARDRLPAVDAWLRQSAGQGL